MRHQRTDTDREFLQVPAPTERYACEENWFFGPPKHARYYGTEARTVKGGGYPEKPGLRPASVPGEGSRGNSEKDEFTQCARPRGLTVCRAISKLSQRDESRPRFYCSARRGVYFGRNRHQQPVWFCPNVSRCGGDSWGDVTSVWILDFPSTAGRNRGGDVFPAIGVRKSLRHASRASVAAAFSSTSGSFCGAVFDVSAHPVRCHGAA